MSKIYALGILVMSVLLLPYCQQEQFTQGKRIYDVNCSNCHMADGKGLGAMYPDITISAYLSNLKSELPCLIINGKQGQIMENVNMPGNKNLTAVGLNNLINYLNHTWGDGSMANLNDIKLQMEKCKED